MFEENQRISISRAPVDNRFREQVLYSFSEWPEKVEFVLLDQIPYILYQMKAGDQQQVLRVKENGTVEPVQLNLALYTNGSSTGDRQNGWQYAIRDGKLCRSQNEGSWQIYSQKSATWFGLLDEQGQLVLAIAGRVDLLSVSAGIVMVSTYGDGINEYLNVIYLTSAK